MELRGFWVRNGTEFILELVHTSGARRIFDVNKTRGFPAKRAVVIGDFDLFTVHSQREFVNKCADNNSFTENELAVGCSQFIERTEIDGGSQQIEVESL